MSGFQGAHGLTVGGAVADLSDLEPALGRAAAGRATELRHDAEQPGDVAADRAPPIYRKALPNLILRTR